MTALLLAEAGRPTARSSSDLRVGSCLRRRKVLVLLLIAFGIFFELSGVINHIFQRRIFISLNHRILIAVPRRLASTGLAQQLLQHR